jgi:NADH dehydrogenase
VNHHCFQPLLYQVATAALSPADIAWPIRSILSRQANARVVMADVTGIDVAAKEVKTDRTAPFRYDFLVIATGATHSYFGHDEWAPFAPGLKRIEDATEIRRRLLRAFETAELSEEEAERRRLMNFIVVGGGSRRVRASCPPSRRTLHAMPTARSSAWASRCSRRPPWQRATRWAWRPPTGDASTAQRSCGLRA